MADNDFIWDENKTNMVEPTQTLFDDGYPEDAVPTSGNINYLFHFMSANRIPVGTRLPYMGGTAPDGYLLCLGETIALSDTTASYYGTEYQDLFIYLWTNDTAAVVTPSKGASAIADWTADKKITIPNNQGHVLAGKSTVTGSTFNAAIGSSVGAETVVLTEAQLPIVTPTITDPGHTHPYETWREVGDTRAFGNTDVAIALDTLTTTAATTGITVNPFGSNAPHPNVQTSAITNFIIKW